MKKLGLLFLGLCLLSASLLAQETFPRNDVKDERAGTYAFTNATVVVDHQTTITSATMLIRDGKVEQVAQNGGVPPGYTQVDLDGKYIYPGFIDIYTNYGLPKVERSRGGFGQAEQMQSKNKRSLQW